MILSTKAMEEIERFRFEKRNSPRPLYSIIGSGQVVHREREGNMTSDEIQAAYDAAKAIVGSWPEWKRNILEHSGKPTVSVPREPVLGENECF